MIAKQISVITSKKVGQEFCSWNISYGVTGELEEGEDYQKALVATEKKLRFLLSERLPIPEPVQAKIVRLNAQAAKQKAAT